MKYWFIKGNYKKGMVVLHSHLLYSDTLVNAFSVRARWKRDGKQYALKRHFKNTSVGTF